MELSAGGRERVVAYVADVRATRHRVLAVRDERLRMLVRVLDVDNDVVGRARRVELATEHEANLRLVLAAAADVVRLGVLSMLIAGLAVIPVGPLSQDRS